MALQLFRLLHKMEVTLCYQKCINKERKPADIPHCDVVILMNRCLRKMRGKGADQ